MKILNVVLLTVTASSYGQPEPVLTVCDLISSRAQYHSQVVAVRGKFEVSEHGEVLRGEGCRTQVNTKGHVWPNALALLPAQGKERSLFDRKSIDQTLGSLQSLSPAPGKTIYITLTGRVETRLDFDVFKLAGGKSSADGFGHAGQFPILLWYRSAKELSYR
jgi:hypothetical protein